MKKLAYIIAFFALFGHAQTRYLYLNSEHEDGTQSEIDGSDWFLYFGQWSVISTRLLVFDSAEVILEDIDYDYFYDSIPNAMILDSTVLPDSMPISPLILHAQENEGCPLLGSWGSSCGHFAFGFLVIEKENYSDSLWVAPIGYISDSSKALDFRNDFLESRDFFSVLEREKYFDDMSYYWFDSPSKFYNDSIGNFSVNLRSDDSLFFIYKRDTSFAVCRYDFNYYPTEDVLKAKDLLSESSDVKCTRYTDDGSQCIEKTFLVERYYNYRHNPYIICNQVNEDEIIYSIIKPTPPPSYIDSSYKILTGFIHQNHTRKTYSPAIYRVNGTNSKNNKSSNILYGKERAVRYLRKD